VVLRPAKRPNRADVQADSRIVFEEVIEIRAVEGKIDGAIFPRDVVPADAQPYFFEAEILEGEAKGLQRPALPAFGLAPLLGGKRATEDNVLEETAFLGEERGVVEGGGPPGTIDREGAASDPQRFVASSETEAGEEDAANGGTQETASANGSVRRP
jgi:hypothetical protein